MEVLNEGRWLTHGDMAMAAPVDFQAVVEHRLIPARVRSEWVRLWGNGLASSWAPASGLFSGVEVVRMRGALVAWPTFATA